jgi:hypothetical protein
MEDLLTLLRMAIKHKGKLSLVALAVLAVAYPGRRMEYVSVSPDGSYRLEHYQPALPVYLYYKHFSGMQNPAFVRLYRNMDNRYFGESPIVDYFGGEPDTYWDMKGKGEVAIGGRFVFHGVPPVGPGGQILAIPGGPSPTAGE